MKKYEMDLCNGPIFKQIVVFSVPLILSGILQLLYNMMDIVVVGQFAGKESLAAVGATSSLINLTTNLFIGISQGTCIVAARYFGANIHDKISRTVHTSMAFAAASGVLIGIYGIFFSKWMLTLTSTPSDVIDLSALYMRVYFIGAPFFMIYNFGSSILRAIGDTKRPLYYLTVSGIVNIVLNLVFVIVFKLGVLGVAAATIIAQMISAVLVVNCLIRSDGPCKLYIKSIKIHFKELGEILRNGVPCGISSSVFSISNVMIQSSINSFGSVVVAGSTAAQNIESLVYISMNSVAQTAMTFTSQNYGAGKLDRIEKGFMHCLIMVFAVGFTMGLVAYIFGAPLLKIFSSDPAIIPAGLTRLKYVCLLYFLCGTMDVASYTVRGLSYSMLAMVTSVLGICGFRIIWLLTFVKAHHTLDAIFVSYPISWSLIFALFFIMYKIIIHKMKKTFAKNDEI